MSAGRSIVLACAADECFAMPLAVALRSALDTLAEPNELAVFVLDGGIRAQSREWIERTLDSSRVHLRFVAPNEQTLSRVRHRGRGSHAMYLRILAADLLPGDVARAIYLDADVVVAADLGRLWAEPLRGFPLLAVRDAGAPTVGSPRGLRNHRALALAPGTPYLNSGVLSLDLARWREEGLGARLLDYLETHAQSVRWWDQDALNAVLAGRWGELDPRWNQIPQIWEPCAGEDDPFTPALRELVIREPWIVHFSTWSKPWHWGCTHPERERFFAALDRTAWAGWRPRKRFRDTLFMRQCLRLMRRALHGLGVRD